MEQPVECRDRFSEYDVMGFIEYGGSIHVIPLIINPFRPIKIVVLTVTIRIDFKNRSFGERIAIPIIQRDACSDLQASSVMMFDFSDIGGQLGKILRNIRKLSVDNSDFFIKKRVRVIWRIRGAATAVSMIRGPEATGAPTRVTTVSLTELSYQKKGPEGSLIQEPFRTSYASAANIPQN
ncbi:hypothetical protein TNCV_4792371 [Trichonephila clavipes]|nr:hypothetical protein TNCV_4792371 [Trichonephila clavipes]